MNPNEGDWTNLQSGQPVRVKQSNVNQSNSGSLIELNLLKTNRVFGQKTAAFCLIRQRFNNGSQSYVSRKSASLSPINCTLPGAIYQQIDQTFLRIVWVEWNEQAIRLFIVSQWFSTSKRNQWVNNSCLHPWIVVVCKTLSTLEISLPV